MNRKLLYPLSKQLQATKLPRTDIVNPGLCDDVLHRLAPSLAQYVGCTIIDINPGVGLFSSKLHNYLKPRSHVLMEPKQSYYLPFLKPLLDVPGSRYHLKDWPDEYRWNATHYIREGLMPRSDGLADLSSTTENPSNLTLLIANIANEKQVRANRYPYAALKVLDFVNRARQSLISQIQGPVRMLMWVQDSDKRLFLPRTVDHRGKLASQLEAYCQVEEIIGCRKSVRGSRREDVLDVRSSDAVAKRMVENNIQTPPGRQVDQETMAFDLSNTSRDWHRELCELEEAFEIGKLPQFVGLPPGPLVSRKTPGRKDPRTFSPEWLRLRTLRGVLKGQNSEIDKVRGFVQQQAEIDQLDMVANREGIGRDEREKGLELLDTKIKNFKDATKKLSKKELYRLMFIDDDRRAMEMDPPLLMWDRRSAEPLIAQANGFHTPREMALLDFQMKPKESFKLTSEQAMWSDMITTALFNPRGPANLKQLNVVRPGAYEALVSNIPAMRDPRKGGRRDVDSVRIRAMTPEIFHELAIAWDNWAFKPSLAEVLSRFNPEEARLLRGGSGTARNFI